MKYRSLCFLALAVASSALASEDPIDRIVAETRAHGQSKAILMEMTGRFGPRVTASPALEAAQRWAVQKFLRYGCDTAEMQKYGEAPVSFQRGKDCRGGLTSPYEVDMAFTTPAYTVGTRGDVVGPAVRCPKTLEEAKSKKGQWKGAWILMPVAVGMRAPRLDKPTEIDSYLDSCGIAGRVYGTTSDEYVWTHGKWTDYTIENRPKAPLVAINHRDFGLVEYNIDHGRKPQLHFNIDNHLVDRPTPLYNVVAEIRGSAAPQECVIVCAHQDSWDGPGSQGAMDNGTGSALVLEVARIFGKLKLRPKRTMRFILWSGEEQGLLGSTAYSAAHSQELGNIQAMINDDAGQNPYYLLNVPAQLHPYFRDALRGLENSYPEYPVKLGVSEEFPNGGSDLRSFLEKGVPGFALQKTEGPVNYTHIWHTQFDRVDLVNERMVKQCATYVAGLAYRLADMPQRLPRVTNLKK